MLGIKTLNSLRTVGIARTAKRIGNKLGWWYKKFSFRPHVIEKELAGDRYQVAINNLFAQGWVESRQQWPELSFIRENMIESGDLVVDCGANNGFTSVFFAKATGQRGSVIAIEPLPKNVMDINQNIALNQLSNIEVLPVAVGRARGEVKLLAQSNGIVGAIGNAPVITVPMESLDEICRGRRPDVIKIDVEGLELDVLHGAKRILQSRPRLAIEVHPLYKEDRVEHCSQIIKLLNEHDYIISAQLGIDEPIEHLETPDIAKLAQLDVFNVFATVL